MRRSSRADADQEPLARQLSVWGLWLLMINGMIGAGIFGVPAATESLACVFSPWIYLICALLIAPVMLCFCQLASASRGTGGPMLYARVAFGPMAGFQAGWAFYVARLTAFAANLNLLVVSLGYFWPQSQGPATRLALLLGISVLLIWLNVAGARAAMRSLGALTVLKLLPLIALALWGAVSLDLALMETVSGPPPLTDLGAALLLVIYAYVGFESGLVPAGEARRPEIDMPRALLWALITCALLYALIHVAAQHLVPDLATAPRPLVQAGQAWLGPVGGALVMLGLLASVGGNLLGSMFSTSRISYRLGLDAQLPAWFAQVHPRWQTPANSVICYGLASFVLAASGSFVWLAVLSVCIRLLLYLLCLCSMPAAERLAGFEPGYLRLPGGPTLRWLAVFVCLGLMTQISLASVLGTLALLLVGSGLYGLARRSSNQKRA